ncbi:MAG: hypothetical protein D6737_15840 [Chloroflexi bacterium]|nr:MAG: hypothetical protein D6737_15840 [Chloroflexota bacterium]
MTGATLAHDPTFGGEHGAVTLELIAEGFTSPVDLKPVPDDSGRLFVVDQIGQIRIITADGELLDEPFLDISDRMIELGFAPIMTENGEEFFDERGLLGLAFHPDYAENGRFFVYYSAPLREGGPEDFDGTNVLAEFAVSDDPNVADPDSEIIMIEIDEPQFNHNGGALNFGPDGYLYLTLGDGGAADDNAPGHTEGLGNAQDTSNLLGSILRLDVDSGDPYGIPEDNPFVGDDGVPDEIWAWGFRNPWRASFDAGGNHDFFVADVGQNIWEEVSIVTSGNYGWNIREGSHCFSTETPSFNPLDCATTGANGEPLQQPIIEYSHNVGLVAVGGYVYRGSALPETVQGHYFFGDWSTHFNRPNGKLLLANNPPEGNGDVMWQVQTLEITNTENRSLNEFVLAFGQDADNELYVLTSERVAPIDNTGKVYKIVGVEDVSTGFN